MSLASLVNGADCGPSTALQSLTKRLDADRGIQQDHFGARAGGPSSSAFRTVVPPNATLNAERAAFFAGSPHVAADFRPTASNFDFSAMNQALNVTPEPISTSRPSPLVAEFKPAQLPQAAGGWAADFLRDGGLNMQNRGQIVPHSLNVTPQPGPIFATPGQMIRPMAPPLHLFPGGHIVPASSQHVAQQRNWEQEFMQQERIVADNVGLTADNPVAVDGDELSRTAGMLFDSLQAEENPKFQKSEFMQFMRQLRDKEMVIDGDQLVPSSSVSQSTTTTNTSTSTTTAAPITATSTQSILSSGLSARGRGMSVEDWPMKFVHFDPVTRSAEQTHQGEEQQGEELSEEDAYWAAENRDYRNYWEKARAMPSTSSTVISPQQKEWDHLQESWDEWEATSTGLKPVAATNYRFQTSNPYVFDSRHESGNWRASSGRESSLLETEAAVLADPSNAEAWYKLGVKQQANEREDKAIQALRKAVELDPSMLAAWMELAVSYTNEGSRPDAYNAISEWIDRNPRYRDIATNRKQKQSLTHSSPVVTELIECLVTMAQAAGDGELDADVQIALGVLLNTTEEYDKARDCFIAALEARPDDYLLYNRVGATIANFGQARDAIPYYHRALALNPTYIRARFNLGISCISLQRNDEAAQHILDALVLQEADGIQSGSERGITSSTLWETLRTVCLHLHRPDLAKICNKRDLNQFQAVYFSAKD